MPLHLLFLSLLLSSLPQSLSSPQPGGANVGVGCDWRRAHSAPYQVCEKEGVGGVHYSLMRQFPASDFFEESIQYDFGNNLVFRFPPVENSFTAAKATAAATAPATYSAVTPPPPTLHDSVYSWYDSLPSEHKSIVTNSATTPRHLASDLYHMYASTHRVSFRKTFVLLLYEEERHLAPSLISSFTLGACSRDATSDSPPSKSTCSYVVLTSNFRLSPSLQDRLRSGSGPGPTSTPSLHIDFLAFPGSPSHGSMLNVGLSALRYGFAGAGDGGRSRGRHAVCLVVGARQAAGFARGGGSGGRGDVFGQYEALHLQYFGFEPKKDKAKPPDALLIHTALPIPDLSSHSSSCWADVSPAPILMFELWSLTQRGLDINGGSTTPFCFFDETYALQSVFADFIHRVKSLSSGGGGVVVVDGTEDLRKFVRPAPPSYFKRRIAALSCKRPGDASERDLKVRALLLDTDLFHFTSLHLTRNLHTPSPFPSTVTPLAYPTPFHSLLPSSLTASNSYGHPLRVCAVLCVYDDTRFVESLLTSLLPSVHHVIVLLSSVPWKGSARNNLVTVRRILDGVMLKHRDQAAGKVSILEGAWKSEAEQRNFGNDVATMLPGGVTHVMVVDGDEFWHPVEIERAFALVGRAGEGKVSWVRAPMATYFGNLRSIVDPPEWLQILWLVSPHLCSFANARELQCLASADNQGQFMDGTVGRCHHLSYVRTDRELVSMKFSSFEHSDEVLGGWIADVWGKWKANPSAIEDLHPTHPSAYKRTAVIDVLEMPPALRKLYESCYFIDLPFDVDGRDIMNEVFGDDDSDAFEMICGGGLRVEFEIDNVSLSAVDDSKYHGVEEEGEDENEDGDTALSRSGAASSPSQSIFIAKADLGSIETVKASVIAQMEDAAIDTFNVAVNTHGDISSVYSSLSLSALQSVDMIDLDWSEEKNKPQQLDCSLVKFLVAIVLEGEHDRSTLGVFQDIAAMLKRGIDELLLGREGADRDSLQTTIIASCVDLRTCKITGERFVIVLGAHHLQRYSLVDIDKDSNSERVTVASVAADFPPALRTAIYNFENVGRQNDMLLQNEAFRQLLGHYGHFWEYDSSNFLLLREDVYDPASSFQPSYVPLGWVDSLNRVYSSSTKNATADIDVLFYGRLNRLRRSALDDLREAGLSVRHVNSNSGSGAGVWGDELSALIRRSKIVLNLRYFEEAESSKFGGEWKMTRFVIPLSSEVMIVSENCGTPEEMSYWKDGIAFASRKDLASTLKHYLTHDEDRQRMAATGKRLFMENRYADSLKDPVERLVQGRCGQGWRVPAIPK